MGTQFKATESLPLSSKDTPPAGRILAIDDDLGLLENFALALGKDGYKVVTAATVADGLRLAATQPFHACLLDRNIGYDSGLDALPKLRELVPRDHGHCAFRRRRRGRGDRQRRQ